MTSESDCLPQIHPRISQRLIGETIVGCIGCALIAAALAADQQWLDRHFLSDFFIPRATFVRVESSVRIAAAVFGAALALLVRRPLVRFVLRDPARTLHIALAVAASFGAAELVLRQTPLRAREEVPARKEPRRHLDARLGWLFVPSRAGYQKPDGRLVEYAFDANGYRVRRLGETVDFQQPTIVFTGESIMVGEKLPWEETIPAQTVELMTRVDGSRLTVHGAALGRQSGAHRSAAPSTVNREPLTHNKSIPR